MSQPVHRSFVVSTVALPAGGLGFPGAMAGDFTDALAPIGWLLVVLVACCAAFVALRRERPPTVRRGLRWARAAGSRRPPLLTAVPSDRLQIEA